MRSRMHHRKRVRNFTGVDDDLYFPLPPEDWVGDFTDVEPGSVGGGPAPTTDKPGGDAA